MDGGWRDAAVDGDVAAADLAFFQLGRLMPVRTRSISGCASTPTIVQTVSGSSRIEMHSRELRARLGLLCIPIP
jgi:hypothetical protein